jgi:hypothetical protein
MLLTCWSRMICACTISVRRGRYQQQKAKHMAHPVS